MSTRGVMGFVIEGEEKISYNHSDSYPDGLGLTTLAFLRETDLALVRELADKLRAVGKRKPTQAQIKQLAQYTDSMVDGSNENSWYQLLRHTQGDWKAILDSGYIESVDYFPLDSLFCEWGYVVDLDRDVLEVYRGFQKWVPTTGRWAGRPTQEEDIEVYKQHLKEAKKAGRDPWRPEVSEFKAIALVGSFPLFDLPTDEDFLAACDPQVEDES